ncbi:MAG: hypothetical protein ABI824_03595 [Acidobacteriota bacterium]
MTAIDVLHFFLDIILKPPYKWDTSDARSIRVRVHDVRENQTNEERNQEESSREKEGCSCKEEGRRKEEEVIAANSIFEF